MRRFLLASAATLGAVGIAGVASAQTAPVAPQLDGQVLTTPGNWGGANNNNNYQTAPLPGAIATPTPGSFVIHLNGRMIVEAGVGGSSLNTYNNVAPTSTAGASLSGSGVSSFATANGTYKQNTQSLMSYFRLYPGVDAMATNGLRYGASVEIRENWATTTPSGGNVNSTSSSGDTSSQTLMVRRAFVYIAGDQWGMLRLGQGDGVPGIFDNGITTFQNASWNGGMNGTDGQELIPGNTVTPFPFYSQDGIEYGNTKAVYLSPQFYGFDFGLQYAPNNTNGEQNGLCTNGATSDPSALGVTGVNATDCSTTSSSPLASDAGRYTNQYVVGARYQGTVGPVGILAHAEWMGSGHVDYTGARPTDAPHGTWNGSYNGLGDVVGGVALTISGFTFGGIVNHGAMNNNGQGSLQPQGAPDQTAYLVGWQYAFGPFTVGQAYENVTSQGYANLTGVTQRREQGTDTEASWNFAPGIKAFAAYWYGTRHQGDFNFATGAIGTAHNNVQSQSLIVGTVVSW